MLVGPGCHEVIGRVKARAAGTDTSHSRKLGLVVEGGAMRGCYTGGSLLGMHLADTTGVFDSAYATSAGVINTAHFLSGVGHRKAGTYYQALACRKFINPFRLWKVADVDYVVNDVLKDRIPLEMGRLLESPTAFQVTLLEKNTARAEMMHLQSTPENAWPVIKASIAMPVLYNRTVPIGDGRYFDGGLAVPFPLREALEDGCRDILLLLSRDPAIDASHGSFARRLCYFLLFARGRRELLDLYDGWPNRLAELQRMALGDGLESWPGVRIATLHPKPQLIGSTTRDRGRLREATIGMAREVLALFRSAGGRTREADARRGHLRPGVPVLKICVGIGRATVGDENHRP